MNPTEFFAKRKTTGDNNCYYCKNPCGDIYTTKEYVKLTFTNRDIVACKNSGYVCENCVICFSEKCNTIKLIDGTERIWQSIRTYSWIVTEKENIAATKAHLKELRNIILNPPEPPFMIVLSDSGQKHLVFRSKIAYNKDFYPVSLEDEVIYVKRDLLQYYFEILSRIIAACGKPLLKNIDQNLQQITMLMFKAFDQDMAESTMELFLNFKDKSLLKLAVWLSPNKEASIEALNSRGIQRKDSKLKSNRKSGQNDGRVREDGGGQAVFDFS